MTASHVEVERSQRATLNRVFPGASFAAPERLSGGISAGATRWDVAYAGGGRKRVVVRAPASDGTVSLQRLLAEAGALEVAGRSSIPAPRVCGVDPEEQRIVLEYVDGQPRFDVPVSEAALTHLAKTLVAIHRVEQGCHDLSFLPRRAESVQQLLAATPSELDATLGEGRVRAALAKRQPATFNPPVLLHGDYWPGNVLWHQDKLVAIIDWEEAEVGDPLADLAITRLDLLWAFGWEAMNRFTELYLTQYRQSQGKLQLEHLPWWDLVAALRPMSRLDQWASVYALPPISRPDVTVAQMAEQHGSFVEHALRSWQ